MEFVKKHYEKILLSVVLAGLVGALVFLPFVIAADKAKMDEVKNNFLGGKATPLADLDLTRQDAVIQRLQAGAAGTGYDFNSTNKLFNPVEWVKYSDGSIHKIVTGLEFGGGAAVPTKITPLYTIVTLDSVTTNELSGARYTIGVERQAAASRVLRQKVRRYVSMDDPKAKDLFTLIKVMGDPVNPDQLVFKWADSGDSFNLSREKPLQRVDGYAVDLKYPPDPKQPPFVGKRLNDVICFGNDCYTIVDIKADEVILSAQSNQKKTILKYAP